MSDDTPTLGVKEHKARSFDDSTAAASGTPLPPLERGTRLAGGRYEIITILGQGGMGAVYKARDHEVDRFVALKVIQPELANSSSILKRFKQELLLARQVTHKNVVRIFDIGESDGMKFITMEYIDGGDLKSLIVERGKIPPQDAVDIIRQICNALDAAHSEGVVHRDLKPQNIMIDQNGRVVVMDFGIAHSKDMPGMTMTGALMGTPDYMSPEQAKAQKTDARSDIFSLGLIFYEMLVGRVPFHAATVVETMFKRTQERAIPPVEMDHSIPLQASTVVMKCLETDPANRYQTIKELLQDIETFDASKKAGAIDRVRFRLKRKSISWKPAAAVIALIAIAVLLFQFSNRSVPATVPAEAPRGMQVLIADFTASDPELEGGIEPMLGLALEGASFITSFDRARARATGNVLKPGERRLDEALSILVAVRDGVDVVVSGSITERGPGYRISAKAIDSASGKTIATATNDAEGKETLGVAVTRLAASLRTALGDTASEEAQLAETETLSTSSVEAYRSYARAQESRSSGKWEEAITYYRDAIKLDPNFGRAYAGIAAAHSNLGQVEEAEKNYQLALARLSRMTDREKYRTRGGYYLFKRSSDEAIDEYKKLVEQYPGDTAGQNNLAVSLFQRRDFTGALVQGRKFVEMFPRNVTALNNLALFSMYSGDFQTTGREATKALELNSSYIKGYFANAIVALTQGRIQDAIAFYEKAKPISEQGAALAAAGLADVALYEGRISDALTILEAGVSADIASNERSAASDKRATVATIYSALGDSRRATNAADTAIASGAEDSVLYRAAHVYIRAGERGKAAKVIAQLSSKLQADSRAYGKILEGESLLAEKNTREAIDKLKEAKVLADTWLGHLVLGRAYLENGSFSEASSEFDTCASRRGEATAVFLDDRPTYHVFPQVLYYQARAQEGLKSPSAVDQYKAFLSLKSKADKDPLVADARKRIQ